MSKIGKGILYLLESFLLLILIILGVMTISATYDQVIIDQSIRSFMKKGVLVDEVTEGDEIIRYFEITADFTFTDPTITREQNYTYFGALGDFFVKQNSYVKIVPFSNNFIEFYFGGHAGIFYYDNSIIETSGMNAVKEENIIMLTDNDLYDWDRRNIIGLRVKNITEDEIKKALDFAYKQFELKRYYNYAFIFNRSERFYCTDLVARSFGKEAGLKYNLDRDGIATSCQDLVVSKDTYITFYRNVVSDELTEIYYLVSK